MKGLKWITRTTKSSHVTQQLVSTIATTTTSYIIIITDKMKKLLQCIGVLFIICASIDARSKVRIDHSSISMYDNNKNMDSKEKSVENPN